MRYKDEISKISPNKELVFETKRKMREISHKPIKTRRYVALAIAIVLIISTTVTAFASGDLVLSQVNKTSIYNGIEMTITDVNIKESEDGDSGEIKFTLRDTTSKNRINDFTDIDNFDVRGFKTDDCIFESFDEKTGTASYILKVKEWPNGGISYFNRHGRITVNAILLNRKSKEVEADINLSDYKDNFEEKALSTSVNLIADGETSKLYCFNYILNDLMSEKFRDAAWLRITRVGFTSNNHLNVGTKPLGENSKYYKYKIYLKDKDGNKVYYNPYSEYKSVLDGNEVIFEVNRKDIDNYTLHADICEYKDEDIIEGCWETVFHK